MTLEVNGAFVSQKINKIRWIPEDFTDPKCFFTGSWDDENNSVKVWTFESPNEEEEVLGLGPRQMSEYRVDGDVTEIKFLDPTHIVVSSSNGHVRVLEIGVYNKQTPLKEVFVWDKLHNYGLEQCSCTALDTLEGELVSVGEDGCINILNSRRGDISQSISNADSCSIRSVHYLKHYTLMTGNVRGHIKLWDLRTSTDKPASSFLLSGDDQAVTCFVNRPTQPDIIVAGSESGALALWDLRAISYPASLFNTHKGAITEMQFHPQNSRKLFSCSAAGELFDWNMQSMMKSTREPDPEALTAWKPMDEQALVNTVMTLLNKSINTLNCNKDKILCGADNEGVYLVQNVRY